MDALLLIARLGLAAVFGLAAVGKFLDLKGSQQAVEDFGVPRRFAALIGLALPVVEALVAIFLLPVGTARYAAIVGFLLMAAFVAGMVWNLRQGKTPDCHCFGQIHSEPISVMTVARNGLIGLVALFVVIAGWSDPGYALLGWVDGLSGFEWTLLVLTLLLIAGVAGLGWVVLQMLGQNGRLLLRLDEMERSLDAVAAGEPYQAVAPESGRPNDPVLGLPVGEKAPDFRLKGVHGETMSLASLLAADKPVLLVFSDPGCGPCNALLPSVSRWQQDHSETFLTAIISRGDVAANLEKSRQHGLGMLLLQEDREISNAYKSPGTPSAVVVNADGTIGSPLAGGAEKIRDLVQQLNRTGGRLPVEAPAPPPAPASPKPASRSQPSPSPAIGSVAPDLALKDLAGNDVQLRDLFTRETVLIFWSPTCGFCQRMVADLKAWEKNAGEDDPQAIVITSGSIEANEAFRFASIVLHDPETQAMRLYGTSGTPTAIKISADGKVASELRVGQPGVMSLLGVESAVPTPAAPEPVKIGEPAPPVVLDDLNGDEFDLGSQAGVETAIIFWNPGCGFCSRMLDDLKAWERERPDSAPELVLVSTGTVEANAAQGLDSPVLIDHGFRIGRSFGASGTPSAVLIDADGKVASRVAVGAQGVFDLLGKPKTK